MTIRSIALLVLAQSGLAVGALAQTIFVESEPNTVKPEATRVNLINPADIVRGTTTGTIMVAGDTSQTTVDTFCVKPRPLPPAIYKNTLTLSSTTPGHTGSILGLTQTGGVIGTTDATLQTSSTVGSPANSNHWFGFGKSETVFYRVSGTTATTAVYDATFSTAVVTPVAVPGTFNAGTITISTVGQTTQDTEIYVYDSNFNPIGGFHNDDEGPAGATFQSRVARTFAAGTYYVAVSDFDTANNLSDANVDEDFLAGVVLDNPDALCSGDRETGPVDYDFTISDGGAPVAVTLAGNGEYDIGWARFNVVGSIPPPPNDACASAAVITAAASGYIGSATNDGSASCDPGGASSRDVWYSYTVPAFAVSGGTFSADTCGSSTDTVLSVYSSCGGSELACNDDCGGAPCGPSSSCLSLTSLAANQTVIIRVSDKGLGGTYFSLNVSFVGNPPTNDLCTNPIALGGPGVYGFDTRFATPGQGTTGACGGPPDKNLWYTYTATTNGTLTLSTCGQTMGTTNDTEIWIYQGAGCPVAPAIACNDDACGLETTVSTPVTCGTLYMIELGNYTFQTTTYIFGTFTVTETGTTCSTPSTSACLGDGTGAPCPCGNNSSVPGNGCATTGSPAGARLTASGIASDETVSGPAADTLVLTASGITGPGLFFQADGLSGSPINFGDGHLCAAVNIRRMGVVFPTAGVASYPGGTTPNEIHVAGAASAGQTKHYQCWYRSVPALCNPGVQNFDLTQVVSLTWAN